jgi:hypothetical protein
MYLSMYIGVSVERRAIGQFIKGALKNVPPLSSHDRSNGPIVTICSPK